MQAISRGGLWMVAPFFLQLLGFGNSPLGGGLCGALFDANSAVMQDQGSGFWYGAMFMTLLGVWVMLGIVVALSPILDLPPSIGGLLKKTTIVMVVAGVVLFVLTRTIGLPVPSSLGLSWGSPARTDPLSLLLMGCGVMALVNFLRPKRN